MGLREHAKSLIRKGHATRLLRMDFQEHFQEQTHSRMTILAHSRIREEAKIVIREGPQNKPSRRG